MQTSTASPPSGDMIPLDDTIRACIVTYTPRFLGEEAADAPFAEIVSETPFHAEAPVMFGRPVEVHRRKYAFGDPGTRYCYSGIERVAAPWPTVFLPAVDRVRERASARFSFALCNLYPDGAAGLAWHADDERDLVAGAPIASLSLGTERDFQMRLRRRVPPCFPRRLATARSSSGTARRSSTTSTRYPSAHGAPRRS